MDAEAKPEWLKVKAKGCARLGEVRGIVRDHGLHTVCDGSRCPNLPDCWGRGTATFMIMGERCTRSCRFCAVCHGDPAPPDPDEPGRVADAIASLGLRHAVVTSVTRDDLEDNGASAFTEVVKRTRAVAPSARIELLVPDMRGERKDLQSIARSGADVIGHNLEVVESIQGAARDPLASYERSLGVLALLANEGTAVTKSSLMLGLGEEPREVSTALRDLRSAGVDIVTIGQYLRPKGGDLPVSRYVTPAEFEEHAAFARSIGFRSVLSGPLVRSSYHASEALEAVKSGG